MAKIKKKHSDKNELVYDPFIDPVTAGHPAYTQGILKPDRHYMVVRNLAKYAEAAGIPEHFIYESAKDRVTDNVAEWMLDFRNHEQKRICGAVFSGQYDDIYETFNVLAGAFIRNFINARVITLTDLIEALKTGDAPDQTVVLIPNFYVKGIKDVRLWGREVELLYGYINRRLSPAKYCTILYVSDIPAMLTDYGKSFSGAFKQYTRFQGGKVKA